MATRPFDQEDPMPTATIHADHHAERQVEPQVEPQTDDTVTLPTGLVEPAAVASESTQSTEQSPP